MPPSFLLWAEPPADCGGFLLAGQRHRAAGGNSSALERLVSIVYCELRAIAARQLRRERGDHTIDPGDPNDVRAGLEILPKCLPADPVSDGAIEARFVNNLSLRLGRAMRELLKEVQRHPGKLRIEMLAYRLGRPPRSVRSSLNGPLATRAEPSAEGESFDSRRDHRLSTSCDGRRRPPDEKSRSKVDVVRFRRSVEQKDRGGRVPLLAGCERLGAVPGHRGVRCANRAHCAGHRRSGRPGVR